MRRFKMIRRVDHTGISGEGHIADGVQFDDGTVVVRWRTATPGTTTFASLDHAKAVHAHGGDTSFVFLDDGTDEVQFCTMCFADDDIAGHCLNCGAGGTTVTLNKGHAELIRKNASWNGRRKWPNDEDRALRAELLALRSAYMTLAGITGRRIEPANPEIWPEPHWTITQELGDRRTISVTVEREGDETPEQALRRTAFLLPVAVVTPT